MSGRQKVLLFLTVIFFLSGCNSNIDISPTIGMSKEETLRLIFDKCPKDENGEINIATFNVVENRTTSYENFYYKSFTNAMADIRLINSNFWEIKDNYNFSFSNLLKEKCLEIYFENGQVIKIKETYKYKK